MTELIAVGGTRNPVRRHWEGGKLLCFFITSIAFTVLVAGCGFTKIRESHILQADDGMGNISYYRVTIAAESTTAKTEWRAGLYDAYALDALFGSPGEQDDLGLDATLGRKRVQAAAELYDRYVQALRDGVSPDELRQLEHQFARAIESPFALAERGSGGTPQRKFTVIYTSNASIVEEAIADVVEDKQTASGVMSLFAEKEREKFLKTEQEREDAAKALGILKGVKDEIDPKQADAGKLREWINRVRAAEIWTR